MRTPGSRGQSDYGGAVPQVRRSMRARPPSPLERLTAREAAVLSLIVGGATNREIAGALAIGIRTVEFHRANVMAKLRAHNVVELMQAVLRQV